MMEGYSEDYLKAFSNSKRDEKAIFYKSLKRYMNCDINY